MPVTRILVLSLLMATMVLTAGIARGQNYPNKPVRIYTVPIGGGNDFAARLISSGISGPLGQQVIVENRPSQIARDTVVKAAPDGYSLLCAGPVVWIGPFVQGILAYDPLQEFAPISLLAAQVLVLVVHPSLPVKSVKELIALAKARPGELNYAGTTPGGNQQLGGHMLNAMAGVKIVEIPYKGGGPAVSDLIGGHVQLMFSSVSSVADQIKAGRLRALGVTSLQPSALAPGLPTLAATGLPGFELVSLDAIYAPAKTPAAIVNQLSREVARFLRTAEGREKYLALGAEAIGSTPEEHVARIKSETAKMSKLIRDAGIKAE